MELSLSSCFKTPQEEINSYNYMHSELVTGVENFIICRSQLLLEVPVQETKPSSSGVIILAHRDFSIERAVYKNCPYSVYGKY